MRNELPGTAFRQGGSAAGRRASNSKLPANVLSLRRNSSRTLQVNGRWPAPSPREPQDDPLSQLPLARKRPRGWFRGDGSKQSDLIALSVTLAPIGFGRRQKPQGKQVLIHCCLNQSTLRKGGSHAGLARSIIRILVLTVTSVEGQARVPPTQTPGQADLTPQRSYPPAE